MIAMKRRSTFSDVRPNQIRSFTTHVPLSVTVRLDQNPRHSPFRDKRLALRQGQVEQFPAEAACACIPTAKTNDRNRAAVWATPTYLRQARRWCETSLLISFRETATLSQQGSLPYIDDEREREIFGDPEGPARVPFAADHRGGEGLCGGHLETTQRDRIRHPGRHAVSVAEQDAPRGAPGL